jgi:hypothetical protein
MVLYNLGAVAILGAAGIWSQPVGVALWPAVVLHAAMTVWCIVNLLSGKPGGETLLRIVWAACCLIWNPKLTG